MLLKNILQKDYTINQKFYQLKLSLNIHYMIPANDSVRLLSQFEEEILAEMTNFLYNIGEISGETIFIDGTKIEAYANKYTFV